MSEQHLSRRSILRQGVQWPAAGTALWVLAACGQGEKKTACADPNSLSMSENSLRKASHYVEEAPDPTKNCTGCGFMKLGETPTACAKCEIFQGPVNPRGHCDSWAKKEA